MSNYQNKDGSTVRIDKHRDKDLIILSGRLTQELETSISKTALIKIAIDLILEQPEIAKNRLVSSLVA